MRLNILIGGKAGQGINKVSEIVSMILIKQGYFVFNYRDYPSLIRGGHNFNILSVSEEKIGSYQSKLDGIVALDQKTIALHKNKLKKGGFVVDSKDFENLGRNLNLALAGALIKILGIDNKILMEEIKKEFNKKEALSAAEKGLASQKNIFNIKKQNNNNITLMTGSQGIAQGAINSRIDRYIAYPMTPATGVMHELAASQLKNDKTISHNNNKNIHQHNHQNNLLVFQAENEIAVVNAALGASFTGAKTIIGTSGGGFDLMCEGISLQGQSEIPLVIYLAARPGPGTGVPTYSSQADLNIALRGGHGEFPRIVIAPGDPLECIEKTNEAFYLSEKFNSLSVILSDKHLAESWFSSDRKPNKILNVKSSRNRKIPGKRIVKASSYEHDEMGYTTESAEIAAQKAKGRLLKYEKIQKECDKFEMIKIHGKKKSKNLIIGWGSTKTVILDAIKGLDYKFLQVLYLMPLSDKIREEMKKAKKIILIEENMTGQLGRIIREKTSLKIKHRILKYDGRTFSSDVLRDEILKVKNEYKK
ncbi:MAG: 2-oxoacid:acceptor oxidoreductase family protein [Nanoarchaeota archaeon]|nr:2-oxoacid:acceptor oxidoreductase family protein [Nanoarchaeota archaeon]MBU1632499.1 2-oxoacid:acceptor oxidoreductase family protein [Nanoarchaeota archaeon]MBU1876703.1 2-oxoacid:acceptor oxidoreductase family protein [Nanoarchaeota archaeon]